MKKSKERIKIELQCIARTTKFQSKEDAKLSALVTYNTVYKIKEEYLHGRATTLGDTAIASLVLTFRRLIQEAAYWEPECFPMWVNRDHFKTGTACSGQIFHKVYFRHGKFKFYAFDSFHVKPSRYTEADLKKLGYIKITLKEVLENWRQFELWDNRRFESLLVYLYCKRYDLEHKKLSAGLVSSHECLDDDGIFNAVFNTAY